MLPPTYPEYLHNLWAREKRAGAPDSSDLRDQKMAARYSEWATEIGALYADKTSVTWRHPRKNIFINSSKDDFLLVTADMLFDPKHASSDDDDDFDDGPSLDHARHHYWREYEERQRQEKQRADQEKEERNRNAEYQRIQEFHDSVRMLHERLNDQMKSHGQKLMDTFPSSRQFRESAKEKTKGRDRDHNLDRGRDIEPEI